MTNPNSKLEVETIEEIFKERPKELLADSGYYSVDNLAYLENKKIKGYIPHQDDSRNLKNLLKDKQTLFDKRLFKYNRTKDQYICPKGKILYKKTIQSKRGLTLYQARDCQQCTKKGLCLRGKAKLKIYSKVYHSGKYHHKNAQQIYY